MNYYNFHIGDYISHTRHLSDYEDLVYRRLLDWYYQNEKPIPNDIKTASRIIALNERSTDVEQVLNEFFVKTENGWINKRADEEIEAFKSKQKSASIAGKASAEARKGKTNTNNLTTVQRTFNRRSTDVQPTNNQEPITNTISLSNDKDSQQPKLPDCPHAEILKLWNKHFPQLVQPRVWEGSRKTNLKARWVQASRKSDYSKEGYECLEKGLSWWDSFFAYIASDTKLPQGWMHEGRLWQPDLPWICNATNFAKIVEGKYDL